MNYNNWVGMFRFNVDMTVWTALSAGICFNKSTIFKYSPDEFSADKSDLDVYLCPELFINGYSWVVYRIVNNLSFEQASFKGYKFDFDQCRHSVNDCTFLSRFSIWASEDFDTLEKLSEMLEFSEKELKKKWREQDENFAKMLMNLFLEAKASKNTVGISEVLDLCFDYLEGKYEEPVEERLNIMDMASKYNRVREELSSKVICQDAAIRKFVQGLFEGEIKLDKACPEALFLFVGPPGVGKTFLASSAAKVLNRPTRTFQMSEYADDESFRALVGFESTYKNSTPGDLTNFVNSNPNAILIFDEIEKAHVNTIRQFLSILEGGTLRDLFSLVDVDFSQTIVIFTTNAGRQFYEEKRDMLISSLPENTIIDALKNDLGDNGMPIMPTEILSRMAKGTIIGFDHMNPAKLVPIIKKGMDIGRQDVEEKLGIRCEFDESLLPYLFLYYLGSNLDARVASTRSKSFIIDSIFNITERIGSNPAEYAQTEVNTVSFEVANEEIVHEYTVPEEKAKIILVSYRRDRALMNPSENDRFIRFDAWDKQDENGNNIKIMEIMAEHKIDAILIDPLMRGTEENDDPDNLEGMLHLNTHGNNVLQWVLSQNNMPPVYVLEIHNRISLVDQLEMQSAGISGVISLVDKTPEECVETVNNLVYEMFLSNKLEKLTSKGRSMDFDIGEAISPDSIKVRLNNFKLVNNMTTDAKDIVVNDADKPSMTFDDVIGAENAKEELRRFISFLSDPERYRRSGRQVSKGILLYGPPGTGKTILAKALASEADCPFISCTGAEFVDGTKNISDVFALARKYAPSVVFIDEIDSFAMARSGEGHRLIINNLLTQMDGFDSKNQKPVFVIAATNAADGPNLTGNNIYLDDALLRRFSRKVYVDLPSKEERILYLKQIKGKMASLDYNLNGLSEEDVESFAEHTAGYSLSILENVINLAVAYSAEHEVEVTVECLVNSFDESIYGEKSPVSKTHIRTTALHEAGHALLGFEAGERFLPECATLVARGPFLGMVKQIEDETHSGYTREELLWEMRIKLAGRAAEIVFNGPEKGLSTGASNDLQGATSLAKAIVGYYGMEEGFLAVVDFDTIMSSPLAVRYYEKINEILKRELSATIDIITEKRNEIELLAEALLEKSRLNTDEMRAILYGEEE